MLNVNWLINCKEYAMARWHASRILHVHGVYTIYTQHKVLYVGNYSTLLLLFFRKSLGFRGAK